MTNIKDYLHEVIGIVQNVDTQKVIVNVQKEEFLNKLKINDLAILSGSNADEKLIGIVTKVSKKSIEFDETEIVEGSSIEYSYNFCSITLVGTFYSKISPTKNNIFIKLPLTNHTLYAIIKSTKRTRDKKLY